MHSRCLALLFLVFDFARSPTDAGTPPDACGRCPGVSAARPPGSSQPGHPRRSCMPCKMSRTSSRLSSPLVSVSLASVSSRPLATWSPLAIILGCPCCFRFVLRPRQKAFWLLTPYCVIASNTSSAADLSSGACFAH